MSLDTLFQAVQKACLPGVWSKGVALSRGDSVLEDARSGDEISLRVLVAGRTVHPKVSLWTEDEDWYCDCGDKADPCPHIAAAVIALKAGTVKARDASGAAIGGHTTLSYRFLRREGGKLGFERWLVSPKGEERLAETLVSRIGGIQSGRIASPPIAATQQDFAVDAALGQERNTAPDAATLRRVLEALEDVASGITLDGHSVRVSRRPTGMRARLRDEGQGFRLALEQEGGIEEVFANGVALCGETLRPLALPSLSSEEHELLNPGGKLFGPKDAARLVSDVIPALEGRIALEIETRRLPRAERVPPRVILQTESLGERTLSVTPRIVYGDPPLAELRGGRLELLQPEVVPLRDAAAEKQLARKLQSELHLALETPTRFEGEQAVQFRLRAQDWWITGASARRFEVSSPLTPRITVSESGWTLGFGGGSGTAPEAAQVLRAWREGREYVPLPGGGWAPLPRDWLERYGREVERLLAARAASAKAPPHQLLAAAALALEAGGEVSDSVRNLKSRLETLSELPRAKLPEGLRAELRHYQRDGIDWLCFLRDSGLGALLADDMGLGKTLQALCAIRGRTLVVMPTSVLHAWSTQLAAFRPSLRVSVYHGPDRCLDPRADVTLTPYSVLRLDREALCAIDWDSVVLDEAQTIKNPESQVAQAAHQLRAGFRLALSGTPVENRLDDLWSQFQFLNPGLLGERSRFSEGFSVDPERLRRKVRPFVLRRLKREVAPELPPRTEVLLHCELSPEERKVYDAVMASTREEVLAALEAGGGVMGALEALLRLRQACCHPGLLPGQAAETSSKVELLLEQLEQASSEGHRSLVFSQWTSLLDRIEPHLASRGIAALRLDGSTVDRAGIVERFQAPGGPPVLLMSLKAGGTGLTLTAADHVFLLDPWWNPAVEDQAADRAHRIGQVNPVVIARLVARDTVEDRILALQAAKQELARSVLGQGGGAPALTREDLLALLTG